MPSVSVIMSTYKEEEKYLRAAIESVLNQTYKDFEFIIILDNPDNTVHISIIEEYAFNDKRIRFYKNEANLGLTKSLNKGLSLAKGRYICRMDADDISENNRIEIQKKYLEENNYDLIGGITQIVDENNNAIYSIKRIPTDFSKIKKIIKYNQCIAHPTWLGKKEIFDNLNGYREIPLCEDYDFTLRAILKGYAISNINEQVLKYRMTSNSVSRNNLLEQFLYSKYITKCYSKKKIADINLAKKYVEKNSTKNKNIRYSKANALFNSALFSLENHDYLEVLIKCIKILFVSHCYLEKIYRLVKIQINAK